MRWKKGTQGKIIIAVCVVLAVLTGLACASSPTYLVSLEKPEGIFVVGYAGEKIDKAPLPFDRIQVSTTPTVVDLMIPYAFYSRLFEPVELKAIAKRYGAEHLDLYATCTLTASTVELQTELASTKIPVRLLLRADDIFSQDSRGTIEEAILSGLTTENYTFYHRVKDDENGIKVVTAVLNNVRATR
jgi:hypothetical protein